MGGVHAEYQIKHTFTVTGSMGGGLGGGAFRVSDQTCNDCYPVDGVGGGWGGGHAAYQIKHAMTVTGSMGVGAACRVSDQTCNDCYRVDTPPASETRLGDVKLCEITPQVLPEYR